MFGRYDDLASLPDLQVCIVGSGLAGLAVAEALPDTLRVLVLEAGGRLKTARSQAFYRGSVSDPAVHPPLENYRVRALGGTGRIWGGRVIPYDPVDFEPRPWVPFSGWPIAAPDLESYYRRAMAVLDAGDFAFDPAEVLPGQQPELAGGLDGPGLRTTLERFSKPTDLLEKYRRRIAARRNLHVVPHCAVSRIALAPDGLAVDHLVVTGPDGRTTAVRARLFVLAAGGLETPRLMLASDDVHPAGVGNGRDLVGRFYQSHLSASAGIARFDPARTTLAQDYARDRDGIYVRRRLWIPEAAQRRHRLLNTTFRTYIADPSDPSHGEGVLSAMYLAKSLVLYEYGRRFGKAKPTPALLARHAGNILSSPLSLAAFAMKWSRYRLFSDRKLPSVVLTAPGQSYPLEFHAEQAPNPDSRVSLSAERDGIGMPRLSVDWRLTQTDVDSLVGSYRLLGQAMVSRGVGVLDVDEAELADVARRRSVVGGHHIGTTRMAVDPRQGVVDASCRVHGIANLFVAGASVFPTSGQANPTLTAVALGLRLADHLAAEFTGAWSPSPARFAYAAG